MAVSAADVGVTFADCCILFCVRKQLEVNENFGKPVSLQKVKSAVQSVMQQRQRQNNMMGAVADVARR